LLRLDIEGSEYEGGVKLLASGRELTLGLEKIKRKKAVLA
jgi:hypothetical protein